jgi:3-methyladenine DNA glycosylase AlkD
MAARKRSRLLATLRRELAKVGTPARARGTQAYMKTTDAFHGVTTDDLRAVCKRVFAELDLRDAPTWRAHVLDVWRGAEFRDERYCAIELAADPRALEFHDMDALPMFEEMIVTGAWWDTVDAVAGRRLGVLLEREPRAMRKAMLAWSRDPDMWKRRSSIICQLRFKERTDLELLYACIEPSLDSREFFLRKAIGWALRELAWTNPREVVRYVRAHRERMSELSKREALKNVLRDGGVASIP